MKTPEEIAGKVMEGNPFSIGNRKVDLKTAAELGIAEERKRWLSKDENGNVLVPADNNDLLDFGERMLDVGNLSGRKELVEELITGKWCVTEPNAVVGDEGKTVLISVPELREVVGGAEGQNRAVKAFCEKLLGIDTPPCKDCQKCMTNDCWNEIVTQELLEGAEKGKKYVQIPTKASTAAVSNAIRHHLNSDSIAAGEAEKEVSSESEREKPERNSDSSKVCACDKERGLGSEGAPEPTKDASPGNPLPRSETSPVADIPPKCRGCGRPIFRGETVTVDGTKHSECSDLPDKDNCPTCGEPWEDHEPQISEKGAGCLCPKDMGLATSPPVKNRKFQFAYGWDNGKLAMEKTPLTEEEVDLLRRITEVAFWEMGERTRGGSGDDQWYVDSMIEHLKKDKNMEILVRIVFLLCRQANPGDELIRSILAAKDEQISKLISDNISFFERGTEWGAAGGKTWRAVHHLCSKCKEPIKTGVNQSK